MVRFKHRYFTVEVTPAFRQKYQGFLLNSHHFTEAILNTIHELHGDFGVAAVKGGFKAKYCNPMTCLGVIRARHGAHRLVASSLPVVKTIQNLPVTVRTLYTGASLKQCFQFAVKYQKQELLKVWNSFPNKSDVQEEVKNSFMDLSVFQEIESNIKIPAEHGGNKSTEDM